MKHLLALALALVLTACTATPIAQEHDIEPMPMPVPQPSQTLEQLPQELTIEYFKAMRLEGNDLELTGVLADNAAYTRYEIRYTSNGLRISGILNIPKGEGPFPLLILNHGYIDPSVYTIGRGLKREQDYLARNGFAVLHTDYRGHGASDPSPDTKEIYDASLEYTMDSINAANAVRNSTLEELAVVDANNVGMMGHSLGGGVTLNVLVAHPNMIDAAVLYAPVSGDAYKNFDRWRRERPVGDNTIEAFGQQGSESWQKLSSINYLENIDDPVLTFHGTSDDDVPIEWSYELKDAMEKAGKDFELIVYDPEEHEFIPRFTDFMETTSTFFKENLTPSPSPSPSPTSLYDRSRITKKPFGKYVTPENSPVSPERFTGYHTGADFEVEEGEDPHNLEVRAICDGIMYHANRVNGYGGVIVQTCEHNGEPVTVVYGHIWLKSVTKQNGEKIQKGDVLAVLGKGYSEETDGERPHLHLGVSRGEELNLRGYTEDADEAYEKWIDPVELLARSS